MFLLPRIIIALLLIIILLYSCQLCFKQREGATFTNLDNNKRQSPLSDSDRSIILLEVSTGIQKHDATLNVVDPKYPVNDASVHSNNDKLANIKLLLDIMKIQDAEIIKLLPNYIPSSDLHGLIDGSLLKELGVQLAIATITPIKSKLDIDPNEMNALSQTYYTASDNAGDTVTAMTLSSQGDSYKTNSIKTQFSNNLVNNQIYNPPQLTESAAQSILETNYLSYMVNIIRYQDIAISTIVNNISKNVLSVYKKNNDA